MSQDLLLDVNGDLLLLNGDWVTGDSDDQHIEDLLDAYPGEYKQQPLMGVYLQRGVNGLIDGSLRRDIKLNLEADGYQVNAINFTDTNLIIDAKRTGTG